MKAIDYISSAVRYTSLSPEQFEAGARLALVTNFTDDVLQKLLIGLSLEKNFYPILFGEPYKQYHFDLARHDGPLDEFDAEMTFFVFDVNPYVGSAFSHDLAHAMEVVEGIRSYAGRTKGHVVIATFESPLQSAYGNLFAEDPLYRSLRDANRALEALSKEYKNVTLLDLDRLMHRFGYRGRDMRGLYAFDTPFSNEFLLALAKEFMSYFLALKGQAKKCIVLDLDNTLWGGIVGEVGPHGIALGPGYPGFAYQSFQRALLSYSERGIVLAIASRNNQADVDEVFEGNQNMILSKEHFGSIQINWGPKSQSLARIAEELNIGLDSIVFLDDDAANREEVKAALPMVEVPDLPSRPEEFIPALFDLTSFNQLSLTEEDRQKGKMYREERQRKVVMESGSDYLGKLGIEISVTENDPDHLKRLAQLSQKTNQYNLTTRRYSEADLQRLIEEGASVFGADVRDRFGHYGIVALTILKPEDGKGVNLDTFLMSCRAMGRGVEFAVLDYALETMRARGYHTVMASFVPTAKNAPVRDLLPRLHFTQMKETPEEIRYRLDLASYASKKPADVATILPYVAITSL